MRTTAWEYVQCAALGISTVKVAEALRFMPEPENATKGIILALLTGFSAALGKWLFEKAKRKLKI